MGRRVFVGNLSWEVAWQDLKDHMRGPNGDLNVLHAEVMMDGSGRSKGCGIVEYASPEVYDEHSDACWL
jgi:RNA recognition motif-containing protein